MSSIATAALNLTFGLLLKKVRDHAANKLKDGDVTNEKCRNLIVRELDNIKTNLDAAARKDLLSSISFLKQGLGFLYLCLDQRRNDETSFAAQEKKEDLGQASKMKHHDVCGDSVLNENWSLIPSEAIEKLQITSEVEGRVASAKASFERSNTEATRAFCNEALSIEDRILATKVRVISRILESLEDPHAAAYICKFYLTELHNVPAVKEMFRVYLRNRIKLNRIGRIKSRIKKKKRLQNVVSVTMINVELFNFTKKFTKVRQVPVYFLDWPMIDIGRPPYHPLLPNKKILWEVEKFEVETAVITQNGDLVLSEEEIHMIGRGITKIAITSKGGIIAATEQGNVFKITSSEVKMFCSLPQEDKKVRALVIDQEDNIYIITECKLLVFNSKGSMKYDTPLEFLKERDGCRIAVSKDKNIFIYELGVYVYVCDSTVDN